MTSHTPTFAFNPKEVLILIQLVELAKADESIYNIARHAEVEQLREKLNKGGVK